MGGLRPVGLPCVSVVVRLAGQRYAAGVCNLYGSTREDAIQKYWRPRNSVAWPGGFVGPRKPGAFLRRANDDPSYSRELVIGRWGLIPWFSKTADIKYATNNARSEELAQKASFKLPWARGQRCIIPAAYFGRCWTLSSVSRGQRERWDLDTRIGTLGHAQLAAARHRVCGSYLPCRLVERVRGRLDFGNRPEADVGCMVQRSPNPSASLTATPLVNISTLMLKRSGSCCCFHRNERDAVHFSAWSVDSKAKSLVHSHRIGARVDRESLQIL